MTVLKHAATAVLLAVPMLVASLPAHARTARQEQLQGYGLYTTSKGVPQNYGGGYYRRAPGYYGGGGYGYRGYRHHRRYHGDS